MIIFSQNTLLFAVSITFDMLAFITIDQFQSIVNSEFSRYVFFVVTIARATIAFVAFAILRCSLYSEFHYIEVLRTSLTFLFQCWGCLFMVYNLISNRIDSPTFVTWNCWYFAAEYHSLKIEHNFFYTRNAFW